MSRSKRKPWVKNSSPQFKKLFNRRYRRVIRQDVKQWRYRYYYEMLHLYSCWGWECTLADFWENDSEVCYWKAFLYSELEPSYPPYKKFNDSYDICDYRYYCDESYYRRK